MEALLLLRMMISGLCFCRLCSGRVGGCKYISIGDMFVTSLTGRDPGLDTLLLMSTERMVIQDDPPWWVRIEVYLVPPGEEIPHGIRYSLTLHDHHNQRLFGIDNAHAPPRRKRTGYVGRGRRWDHRHVELHDPGSEYEFSDAGQLLVDFWKGVDETLSAHGYPPIDDGGVR